jgi:hypothetical protein
MNGGVPVATGGRRLFAIGLMGVSAIVCLPIVGLASAFLLHAPNRWAVLYPWALLFGAWLAAWLLLRAGFPMLASLLLVILSAFLVHSWLQFEPP